MALRFQDWGLTRYSTALDAQLDLVRQRIANEMGDTLVFTEHHPVYTIGRRKDARRHLLSDIDALQRKGIDLVETNRGGDITYHGPGQLVGYLIVSLESSRDLHRFLRDIEQAIIDSLGSLGLATGRREGLTGIWLDRRKIAAIGVAVKRWVTYHGFALNIDTDPDAFAGIVPCGISADAGSVTSLRCELGERCPPPDRIKSAVAEAFGKVFDTRND